MKQKRWTVADWNKHLAKNKKAGIPPQGTPQDIFGQPVMPEKPRSKEEQDLQIDSVENFHRFFPAFVPLFFHIANQAVVNNAHIGGILKAMGRLPGVWDCCLLVKRHGQDGIWIEFKAPGGKLSPEQISFRENVTAQGYNFRWLVIDKRTQFLEEMEAYLQTGRLNF